MIDKLLLLSGEDIPFPEATINIHPPKLREISLLNEIPFYKACNTLTFSKDSLSTEDKIDLENITNFEIIMSMMSENSLQTKQQKIYVEWLFSLLFPMCQINFTKNGIIIIKENDKMPHIISSQNYDNFKDIIVNIFCLTSGNKGADYNTNCAKADAIKQKILEGRRKAAAAKGQGQGPQSILDRYVSILSIGNHQDINEIMNYTVYQLFDAVERLQLKQQQDFYIKAKMAGAKDLKEVDDWMKDIHS